MQWQPPKEEDNPVELVPPVKKGGTPQLAEAGPAELVSHAKEGGTQQLVDAGPEAPRTPDKEELSVQLKADMDLKASPRASKPGGPIVRKHGVKSDTEAAPPAPSSASARAAAKKGEAAAGSNVEMIKAAAGPVVSGKKEQPGAVKKLASEYAKMEAVRKARIMKRAQWHQLVQEEPDAATELDQGLAPATPSKSEGTCSEEDEVARKERDLFLQRALKRAPHSKPKDTDGYRFQIPLRGWSI